MSGGVTIDQIRSLNDPIKGYQFKMTISPVIGPIGADSSTLSLLCTALNFPMSSVDQVPIHLGGFTRMVSGRRRFGDHTWVTRLYEGVSADVIRRMSFWQSLCYDQITGIALPTPAYQSTALVELFDNPGNVVYSRRIIGIWPRLIQDLGFDMNSPDAIILEIGWSYDFWEDLI